MKRLAFAILFFSAMVLLATQVVWTAERCTVTNERWVCYGPDGSVVSDVEYITEKKEPLPAKRKAAPKKATEAPPEKKETPASVATKPNPPTKSWLSEHFLKLGDYYWKLSGLGKIAPKDWLIGLGVVISTIILAATIAMLWMLWRVTNIIALYLAHLYRSIRLRRL